MPLPAGISKILMMDNFKQYTIDRTISVQIELHDYTKNRREKDTPYKPGNRPS